MDVLSYASDDYKAPDEERIWRPPGRMSFAKWKLLGLELQAKVIPPSFWRSRLRKLLVNVDNWTIAVDEVGRWPHMRARVLFEVAHYPLHFEIATGVSNPVGAWVDASFHAVQHHERLWVEPRFDARCSVFTNSPVTMQTLLEDQSLRSRIMTHPSFTLTCSPAASQGHLLLSLIPRHGGVDLALATSTRDLLHALLLRLTDAHVATGTGVPWTLNV